MPVAYTVIASLPSRELCDQFVAWLTAGHLAAVIGAGAQSGTIVRLDPEGTGPWIVEVRYLFASRDALETYVREHAPGLRQDGLRHFGPDKGITIKRTIGEVV